MKKSVYIHIPFCRQICAYCDFCKKIAKNQNIYDYLKCLENEISIYIEKRITIDSLYFGGGTPSILNSEQLKILNNIIERFFILNPNCEVTFECNIEDITTELISTLKKYNINRLSIGCQSLNDDILKNMRRIHLSEQIYKAIKILENFENVSLDFMFDFPNETIDDIEKILNFIHQNSETIKHISFYSLILEKNTIMDSMNHIVDEEVSQKKYKMICEYLKKIGYVQYEISNFSKIGFESYHNKVYWDAKNYYGFGLGASGYLDNIRYTNTSSMNKYKHKCLNNEKPIYLTEQLTDKQKLEELIILNLRTINGMKYTDFKKLNLKIVNGLEIVEEHVRIKQEYLYISNEIIVNLLEQI